MSSLRLKVAARRKMFLLIANLPLLLRQNRLAGLLKQLALTQPRYSIEEILPKLSALAGGFLISKYWFSEMESQFYAL